MAVAGDQMGTPILANAGMAHWRLKRPGFGIKPGTPVFEG